MRKDAHQTGAANVKPYHVTKPPESGRQVIDQAVLSDCLESKRNGWIVARLRNHSFLSNRFPYLYMSTPKCASTATMTILWAIEGYPIRDFVPERCIYSRDASDPRPSLATIPAEDALDNIYGGRTVRFCVWRDPVDRLVSAFANKIVAGPDNPTYAEPRTKIVNELGPDAPKSAQFESFVAIVADTPDHLRDVHWRSQTALNFTDAIPYDYVVRQSHLHKDLPIVLEAFGAPVPGQEFLRHRWQVSDGATISISASTADRIRAIYEQDYALPRNALRGAFS